MFDIRDHGGNYGGGVSKGNIDVFRDLKMDYPLTKPLGLEVYSYSQEPSYDMCGDLILISSSYNQISLKRLNKDSDYNTTQIVTRIATGYLTALAVCFDYFSYSECATSPKPGDNLASTIYTFTSYCSLIASKVINGVMFMESDGVHIYVLTRSKLIKMDKNLNIIVTVDLMTSYNAFLGGNRDYRMNLFVQKNNKDPYLYISLDSGDFVRIVKALKSDLSLVVSNASIQYRYGGRIIGVDYDKENVYAVHSDSSYQVKISVFNHQLSRFPDASPINYNGLTTTSALMVGKVNNKIIYNYQNGGSYPRVVFGTWNRDTQDKQVITSARESSANSLGDGKIAYDMNMERFIQCNTAFSELNLGFYKI